MQSLKMPEIRRASSTPAVTETAMTFAAMRELRTTARSLPEWAALRARWSASSVEINGTMVPVLQESITALSPAERAQIETKIAEVERIVAVERWPVVVDEDIRPCTAEQAKLILVTKMLMAKASPNVTPEGAAARGESFLIALSDVPAWAVEAAIRAWYRGEVATVEKQDFKWAPDSSILRRAAQAAVRPYEDLLETLRRVLAAKHLSEIGS
jgi:hypothetical protein